MIAVDAQVVLVLAEINLDENVFGVCSRNGDSSMTIRVLLLFIESITKKMRNDRMMADCCPVVQLLVCAGKQKVKFGGEAVRQPAK